MESNFMARKVKQLVKGNNLSGYVGELTMAATSTEHFARVEMCLK
jgi:hypothetical protein